MTINKNFLNGYNEDDLHLYEENKESMAIRMSLPVSFTKLLEYATHLEYIGTGNPNADILIIGKEMAIDVDGLHYNPKVFEHKDDYINSEKAKYDTTVKENIKRWNKIKNSEIVVVQNLIKYEYKPDFWEYYTPVFPYYMQKGKCNTKHGTSRTEYAYQKLIDNIYNESKQSEILNFHAYSFMSELSTEVAVTSNNTNKGERLKSLKERKILWNSEFFTSFPITILAVGHYIDIKENGEKVIKIRKESECDDCCFDIEFYKDTIDVENKFINVHFITDKNGKERMLIHTNQMSAFTNDLINRIGYLCKIFLEQGQKYAKETVDNWLKNNL